MKQWVTALIAGSLSILQMYSCSNERGSAAFAVAPEISNDEDNNAAKAANGNTALNMEVKEKWDMPEELTEVSGIAYMDKNRFACVQDEKGSVFIYNTAKKQIEKELPFAGAGDYEGIALNGNTAYVVRSDGTIYELDDVTKDKPSVKTYQTGLTEAHNIEGFCYDTKGNRLLLASKDGDPGGQPFKGIYAFDIASKKLALKPLYTIDVNDPVFSSIKTKKESGRINPSAMAIQPATGDLYITDGREGNLLILDANGRIKDLVDLGKDFKQPEGISFSPEGTLYISNEGKKKDGNIMQLEVK